jgi:hypothetical protein
MTAEMSQHDEIENDLIKMRTFWMFLLVQPNLNSHK